MDVAPKDPTLEEMQEALGITKDTHPTEVAWLEKNFDLVPWDRVKTLDQLREFVEQRVAQRMELGQYDLTAEGTILAEGSEMRALSIKARKGDLEALRAIELHEKGGWEMVIKEHYNPKRNSNLDLWKWYLKEENLEYAQDPFWQDLVWDIPVSYLQERGNFGIGKIAALKPGVLDKLRDDVEFENIDLPKAYRELMQQLAASSQEDLPREWNNKTWIYLPSRDEDPQNYDANVRKFDKFARNRFYSFTISFGKRLLDDSSFWLLRDKRKIKIAIRLRSGLVEVKTESNKQEILDEHIDDVLSLLRQKKIRGAELFIAEHERDPKRQIEIAQSNDREVLECLGKNKRLVPEVQIILAKKDDPRLLERLAENPVITPQTQLILAQRNIKSVNERLTSNKNLAPEVVPFVLDNFKNESDLIDLARRGYLCPRVQIHLAKSDNKYVQFRLAENKGIADEAQVILAKSKYERVKQWLVELNKVIPEAQQIIAQSEDLETLRLLASSDKLIPRLQIELAKKEDPEIHKRLASNRKLIPKVQIMLAKSGDMWTGVYLASNRDLVTKAQLILAKSQDECVLAELARNKGICLKVQRILVRSEKPDVLHCLAENESITDDIQLILAKSKDELTQICLAGNPKLCPQAQLDLAKSPYPKVLECLSQRLELTQEARQILETPGYSLQQSKEDANQGQRHGQTQQICFRPHAELRRIPLA
jgi:hypothetical protein